MKEPDRKCLGQMFKNGLEIDTVVKRAVRNALVEHKRLKRPVVGWNGKRIVVVKPDEIAFED